MLLYNQVKGTNEWRKQSMMKEYKVRYVWNGKIYAELRMGANLNDAVISFINDLHRDTNSYERIKAGFKLLCE